MKYFFRAFLVIGLFFVVGKYLFFNYGIPAPPIVSRVVEHSAFYEDKVDVVNQRIRLQGVVKESFYAAGIGYYSLQNSKRESIGIICDHFPPREGQVYEVEVFVRPIFKFNTPVTLQVEVDTPAVILPTKSLRR